MPSDPEAVDPSSTAIVISVDASTEKLTLTLLLVEMPPTDSRVIATSLSGVVQKQGRVKLQSASAVVSDPRGIPENVAVRRTPESTTEIDHSFNAFPVADILKLIVPCN